MSIDTDVGCPAGCAIIGAGRVGTALAAALRAAGIAVEGPLGRGEVPTTDGPVLLCVPDAQIAVAAATLQPGRLVGHTSGATTLDVLTDAGHEAFSLHPLMTIPLGAGAAQLAGAPAAVAGSTPRALRTARALAHAARPRSDRRSPTPTGPRTTRPPRSPRTCSSRSRTAPSASWPPRAPTAQRSCRSSAPPSRPGPGTAASAR